MEGYVFLNKYTGNQKYKVTVLNTQEIEIEKT